jgi:hypothetical protein
MLDLAGYPDILLLTLYHRPLLPTQQSAGNV